jgi:hypothetical protein
LSVTSRSTVVVLFSGLSASSTLGAVSRATSDTLKVQRNGARVATDVTS